MMKHIKKYLTTAEAANELGASVGTVQKLATNGAFETIRTVGGHRRILVNSFEKYKNEHGYSAVATRNLMCIFHQGDDLDLNFMRMSDANQIKFLSHPLELLGLENSIACLFIDARNNWLQTTPMALMTDLQKKYQVFIYNTQSLKWDSDIFAVGDISLIPQCINYQFIAGYRAGCRAGRIQWRSATRFND